MAGGDGTRRTLSALSPSGCPLAAVNSEHFVKDAAEAGVHLDGACRHSARIRVVWFGGRSRPEGKQARSEPGLAQRPTRFSGSVVSESASSNTYTRTHCHFRTWTRPEVLEGASCKVLRGGGPTSQKSPESKRKGNGESQLRGCAFGVGAGFCLSVSFRG